MSDPFAPNSNSQLIREAQIGLSLIAILLGIFAYVVYHRLRGWGQPIQLPPPVAKVDRNSHENLPRPIQTSGAGPVSRLPRPDHPPHPMQPSKSRHAGGSELAQVKTGQSVEGATLPDRADRLVEQALRLERLIHENKPKKRQDVGRPDSDFVKIDVPHLPPPSSKPNRSESNVNVPPPFSRTADVSPPPASKPDRRMDVAQVTPPSRTTNPPEKKRIQPVLLAPHPVNAIASDKRSTEWPVKPSIGASPGPPNELRIGTESRGTSGPARASKVSFEMPLGPEPARPSPVGEVFPRSTSDFPVSVEPNRPRPATISHEPVRPASVSGAPGEDSQKGLATTELRTQNVYRVGPNDSFWTIAQKRYGDGRYFRALYFVNQDRVARFDVIPAGSEIEVPDVETLRSSYPQLCPKEANAAQLPKDATYYVTSEGDTLFGIARQRLGQASRYLEILERNSARLPSGVDHLTPLPPGLRLEMPASGP